MEKKNPEFVASDVVLADELARRRQAVADIAGMGRELAAQTWAVISTGLASIDKLLAGGVIPRGCFIEIAGTPSSGKTALALSIIRQAQKNGGIGAFIDIEQGLTREQIIRAGVDPERLFYSALQDEAKVFDIAELLICSNSVDVLVLDTLAAILPVNMSADGIFDLSELLSRGLRRLQRVLQNTRCSVILLNRLQRREYSDGSDRLVSVGGNAVKLRSAVRLALCAESGDDEGIRVDVEIIKGGRGQQERFAGFVINFAKGIISG